ncbi:MAG: O-antigen ligase family protein [Gammaproteobacteria bacterium]|nr:O-antigen ligase family protein [Gammaproteobacteria bacterium]
MPDFPGSLLSLPVIAAGSAAAAVALFMAAVVLHARAEAGLAVLVGILALTAVFGPLGIFLGAVQVTPYDLLCILFVFVAAIRWSRQSLSLAHIVWIGFGGSIFYSLILGVGRFGMESAGNEARVSGLFYFWASAAYFSSFDRTADTERRWVGVLACGGAVLTVLVLFRWGLELAGIEIAPRGREIGAAPFRVVPSEEAMFLVALLLITVRRALDHSAGRAPAWLWAAAAVLMLEVLLLQHRSVWLGALAGLAVLIVLEWDRVRRLLPYVAGTGVLVGLLAAAMLTKGTLDGTVTALSYSLQNEGTMEWRVEGWADLLAQWQNAGGLEKLFGGPFGTGFRRYMASLDVEVERSPHNSYVTLLLRVGVLGLALFALAYVLGAINLVRLRRRHGSNERVDYLLCVLAAQCVYFVFYDLHIMQAVFLGAAIGLCAAPEERPAQVPVGDTAVGRSA